MALMLQKTVKILPLGRLPLIMLVELEKIALLKLEICLFRFVATATRV